MQENCRWSGEDGDVLSAKGLEELVLVEGNGRHGGDEIRCWLICQAKTEIVGWRSLCL